MLSGIFRIIPILVKSIFKDLKIQEFLYKENDYTIYEEQPYVKTVILAELTPINVAASLS